MRYEVKLQKDDNGTFLATFPAFPEAVTYGETKKAAIEHALDAIETAIQGRISDKEPIPAPIEKPRKGKTYVTLPSKAVMKTLIYQRMLEKKISKAQLARRLKVHRPQVDRLLDLRHSTRLDQMDEVMDLLGGNFQISAA